LQKTKRDGDDQRPTKINPKDAAASRPKGRRPATTAERFSSTETLRRLMRLRLE
jgi:hypothetical protein